ncbi:phosphatidate cytidylyltransferase [Salinimicrobium sediminilitoris]|uniref:phosphatidate cytidylyltransferase n=1 Tax=Salinimicrobium sediminilitoris TaxID=2876715 RepID=UPI001E4D87F6|nr:phosphatidate cytidylyltransferase [Salinimicrobium sediminilitoris]MCC8360729.1 phosphatidate cytidylyltransferase [Salinimicrobium sediminilitoris]
MKENIIRGLSGVMYVSILVVSIFASEFAFTTLFLLFGVICLRELQRLLHLKSFLGYFLLIGLFVIFSYMRWSPYATLVLLMITIFVNLFLVKDLMLVNKIPLFEKKKYVIIIFYLIASMIFLTLIPSYTGDFTPELVVGIFSLIWINDTFAYLVGKNFGKKKLFERISPKKTVEGFVGGLTFSAIAAYLVFFFTGLLDIEKWIGLAVILSIFGTLGDLIQSKFKRQAGVKDSGRLMPGHGGLFDRLDSIIFSSPFVYAYLQLINYVS